MRTRIKDRFSVGGREKTLVFEHLTDERTIDFAANVAETVSLFLGSKTIRIRLCRVTYGNVDLRE